MRRSEGRHSVLSGPSRKERRTPRVARGYRAYHGRKRFGAVLLSVLLLVVLGAAVWAYARYVEPQMLRTEHLSVHNALVTRTVRVAAISDLHIGRGCDSTRLEKVLEAISALKPDVVVFLGDLFDDYSDYTDGEEERITQLLAFPALADVPKYAVYGNHDLGGGAQYVYAEVLENAGWTLLRNAQADLDGNIRLIGADDLVFGEPNAQECVDGEKFNLLLCHEPDYAESVTGVQLQLSGHTHGLQINLPFSFWRERVAPYGGQKYLSGLYAKDGGGQVYVNRGIGMSLMNYRLFAVPEVTLVEVAP